DAGSLDAVELAPHWWDGVDPELPRTRVDGLLERCPLEGAAWRIVAVRSVVLGPGRFNDLLSRSETKAQVHFRAFSQLLNGLWDLAADGMVTHVRSDKHGGRHFYLNSLYRALPDVWIDRGDEGRDLSHYTIR